MQTNVLIQDGQVVSPAIHDANIVGMACLEDKSAAIAMNLLDGSRINLIFEGVKYLRANNFREGITVLYAEITVGDEISIDDIVPLYDNVSPAMRDGTLQTMVANIHSEGLMVVSLSSSYGVELTCVCKEISAQPRIG
ncbi:hypothetical protein ABIE09_002364 [Lysobacter enzymogenes]|uniref:hypothetical protein n=1 Tax=Lysobacter enzymogenes TaxID=69 RepID=UPI00339B43F3